MANYTQCTRSSWFRVKDRTDFDEWFNSLHGFEDGLDLWTQKASTKNINQKYASDPEEEDYELVAFGGYCGFPCEREITKTDENGEEFEDYEEIDFTAELQQHVHEDWTVILQEVGNEKLRYLVGMCVIVDSESIKWVDLTNWAVENVPDGSKFTTPES